MIDNDDLKSIWQTANDISTVAELYDSDAVPGDDGFDPSDAIACYSAVHGITFMDIEYTQLVREFGSISRSMGKEANTASVTFDNTTRVISRFEFNTGFEGLVLVIRCISRSQSDSLDKSQILFAGRCDKPTSGSKESLTVNATWVLGGIEVTVPRRKFTADDQEGRVVSDPEFEGFIFMPQEGIISYSVREGRRKYFLFGPRKTVVKTLQYSSHSDVDANKSVPELFGRVQVMLVHIAYADVGTELRMRDAICEGEIYDVQDLRAVQTRLALIGDWSFTPGSVGAANDLPGSVVWPGNNAANEAFYSRTAQVIAHASNSLVEEDEPAPDLVAVILARLVTIPDGSGDWANTDQFSNDAAAFTRWFVTAPEYFNNNESWFELPDFTETWNYNREMIVKLTASDYTFLTAG